MVAFRSIQPETLEVQRFWGGTNFGLGLTQLCGCGGVYADRQGLLYVSDTPNHRILLYNTTAGSITLLIGTNGIFGSQSNQLNNPCAIYVNENNTVFVHDSFNKYVFDRFAKARKFLS